MHVVGNKLDNSMWLKSQNSHFPFISDIHDACLYIPSFLNHVNKFLVLNNIADLVLIGNIFGWVRNNKQHN